MENFSFLDIFATKGLEYLFVIGFLVMLVLFFWFLEKPNRTAKRLAAKVSSVSSYWFRLVQGLFYHQGHTWVRPEGHGIVKVGLDDFAQLLVGKPESLKLPVVGANIEQGGKGLEMKIDGKTVSMLSPVSGEVIGINENIINNPARINEDPYNEGWLFKVKNPAVKKDFSNLLSGDLAVTWMEHTATALQERMSGELGAVLQDGGVPVLGFAKQLSPENWENIASEFFLTK